MKDIIRESLFYVKKRALDILCTVSIPCRRFSPEKNILIFSYPRSGSTWLMELVNNLPHTVNLWEPLHLRNVAVFRELEFGWRQHIPEGTKWEEAEQAFENLLRGRYLNFWLASRSFPLKFCLADRMIIKFVRANGLLPWLTQHFSFQYSPLYLLRHPFAVAASQLKEGSWDYEFDEYNIPQMPYNSQYVEHSTFLKSLSTKHAAMVATWCINNKYVLEHPRHNIDWIPVYYENLLLDPERQLQDIFKRWEEPYPAEVFSNLRGASSTTKEATFRENVQAQLSKWQHFFEKDEIEEMQAVLDYFGVNIYSKDLMPHK